MSSYSLPNPLSSLESPSLADTNEVSCGMRGSPDLGLGAVTVPCAHTSHTHEPRVPAPPHIGPCQED